MVAFFNSNNAHAELGSEPRVAAFGRARRRCLVILVLAALITLDHDGFAQEVTATPHATVDSKPTFVYRQFDLTQPLRLIAYGDMRFAQPSITRGTNPKVRRWP